MPTKDEVIEKLKTVMDPHIGVDIYRLGLIYEIEINDRTVTIKMTLTNPACPMAKSITGSAKTAVEKIEGVDNVNLEMVFDPPWNPQMMSDDLKKMWGVKGE